MLNSSESPTIRAWPYQADACASTCPRPLAPTAPESARYALEDCQGGAIECPICGATDRWRVEGTPRGQHPGFACRHLKEISAICLAADLDGGGLIGVVRSLSVGMLVARVPWATWREIGPRATPERQRSIS